MSALTVDPTDAFARAVADAGIAPPDEIIADGRLHRFTTNGKRGDDAGWYVLHVDGIPAGTFGDWRSGVTGTWCARSPASLSPVEREAHRRRIEAARKAAEAERERTQAEAAERARDLWNRAKPEGGDHRYLRRKGVRPHGARTDGERLLVPMRDTDGKLWNVQRIAPDGAKRFLPGGRVRGLYYSIGRPGGVVVLAEGFATGASVHESTGHAVAVAFSASNLKPVAEAVHRRFPAARIIIAGDDDASGTGQRAALEAARAVGGLVAIPESPGDWNDVAQTQGAGAVRQGIERARAPEPAETAARPAIQVWDWSGFVGEPPPVEWVIKDLLPAGGAVDVYGPPGARKSTLIYHLAATIAAGGGNWFRWQVAGGKVAIVGGESSTRAAHWRMARRIMSLAGREQEADRIVTIPNRPILRWARGYQTDGRQEGWDITPTGLAVIEWLQEYRPALVIVDTILAAAHGCNVIDVAQQYALAEELGRIARELDTTIVTISHTSQASMGANVRLDSRLHYTARSGSNGAPGAWRWMCGVTGLRAEDGEYLGTVARDLDLDSGRYFAVGVSKHNEIEQPRDMHWTAPAIFEARAGELLLVADGKETAESIRIAASERKDRRGKGRNGNGGWDAAQSYAEASAASESGRARWSDERPF